MAENVMVTGDVPLSGTLAPVAFTVSVEPMICIGNCAVTPALAVMVAVRLALLAVPEEKVKVALPLASVVTVGVLTIPVFALKLTTTPDMAAFPLSNAVTVTVAEVELSDLTVVGIAESDSEEAVEVVTTEKLTGPPMTRLLGGRLATGADAEIVVLPVAMAVRVAVALPEASVVADAGETDASSGLATLNVTATPGITTPAPSLRLAVTIA